MITDDPGAMNQNAAHGEMTITTHGDLVVILRPRLESPETSGRRMGCNRAVDGQHDGKQSALPRIRRSYECKYPRSDSLKNLSPKKRSCGVVAEGSKTELVECDQRALRRKDWCESREMCVHPATVCNPRDINDRWKSGR